MAFILVTFFYFQQGTKTKGTFAIFVISIATFVSGAYALYADQSAVALRASGWIICVVSAFLFFWTFQTVRKKSLFLAYAEESPIDLVTDGPFRFVRHPFYLSYLIFWFGMWVSSPSLLPFFGFSVLLFLYYQAAKDEEQKFSNTNFSDSYQTYTKNTGFFLPRMRA